MTTRAEPVSAADLINLTTETPHAPMHVAALIVLDRWTLPATPAAALRERVADRVTAVPRLRQVVRRAGRHWVWIEDPDFAVDNHVGELDVAAPGGEDEVLAAVARAMEVPLPRSRPLWRLWALTGLRDGRVAILVLLHHAVADGLAAVRMVLDLLGAQPLATGTTTAAATTAGAPPAAATTAAGGSAGPADDRRPEGSRLARRWRAGLRPVLGTVRTLAAALGAPRTSLNAPVGAGRRYAVLRLDLAEVRTVAHAYGGKVNDVLLALIAGGVRRLLASRGEAVPRRQVRAAVAMSFRDTRRRGDTQRHRNTQRRSAAGNQSGTVVVRLPVAEADPGVRLRRIAAASGRAKRYQSAPTQPRFLAMLARFGILHWFIARQRMTNLIESNVTGPAQPLGLLGARVVEVVPVGALAGNLTLSFLALSYAGRLTITVCADMDRYPDLPVLLDGARREYAVLRAGAA